MPEELDVPYLPSATEHVVKWFADLARKRQTGMGISPMSYSDIEAWLRINKLEIYSWELDLLLELDDIYVKVNSQ